MRIFKRGPRDIKQIHTKEQMLKTEPEVVDAQSASGHEPDPEEIEGDDVLDRAKANGLYSKADEEHPEEVGVGEQLNENEDKKWED